MQTIPVNAWVARDTMDTDVKSTVVYDTIVPSGEDITPTLKIIHIRLNLLKPFNRQHLYPVL